ncbi:hypothetical protein ACMYR2_0275 [Nitrobacter sp. TKz-YC01]
MSCPCGWASVATGDSLLAELDRDKTRDQLGDTVHLEGHRAALVIAVVFIGYSSAFAQNVVHNARGFECGFIYEKTKNGKSGDASCSYTGETVFSSASRSLPRNEHCYTKNVFSYEDFNLQIDLAASKVVWDREDGLAPFAFTRMVEYYMRTEKIGKEEATRRVAVRWTRLVRQFGGLAKVDRVRFYAANCSVISAIAWTSSGVLPAKVECGRRRL